MGFLMRLWGRLVRFGFRLLYNEMAFTYDLVSKIVSLGAWRCWQRAVLSHLEGSEEGLILELAHGTGDIQLDLHAAGYHAVGYDLSPYMGRIAKRKLAKNGVDGLLVRGMAQQLPFQSGTFTAVISTFPTEFIVAPETLREVNRILVDDGRFVIVPTGQLVGGGVIKGLIEWLYRITGQREGPEALQDIAGYFTPYGFSVDVKGVACPNSQATVIVARKMQKSD